MTRESNKPECPKVKRFFGGEKTQHLGPFKTEFGLDWEAEVCEHCGKDASFKSWDLWGIL